MKIKSITVIGRKWYDRRNGNTYHSARVFADGHLVATVPFQYGYGNQFEWNATTSLERSGVFKGKDKRHVDKDRQSCESGWSWIHDRLGIGWLVDCAECSKRECVEWGKAEK